MDRYEEIFKKRGKSYHQAMQEYPNARDEEFIASTSFLHVKADSIILDIPAGGGYLKQFLPINIQYLAYDFAGEFDDPHAGIMKCKESVIELPAESVDEVLSLAANHHIVDRHGFYGEIFRILKPRGQLVIADVVKGSPIDPFLNVFLDAWNSMGHQGRFLETPVDKVELEAVGFSVKSAKKSFFWNFENEIAAFDFFRKLFYLDKNPKDGELREALIKLGIEKGVGSYQVSWSLGYLIAEKK